MARSTMTQSSATRPWESRTADIPPQVKRQIAELAYRLYEERGRQPGRELEDWLEAERKILGRDNRGR